MINILLKQGGGFKALDLELRLIFVFFMTIFIEPIPVNLLFSNNIPYINTDYFLYLPFCAAGVMIIDWLLTLKFPNEKEPIGFGIYLKNSKNKFHRFAYKIKYFLPVPFILLFVAIVTYKIIYIAGILFSLSMFGIMVIGPLIFINILARINYYRSEKNGGANIPVST